MSDKKDIRDYIFLYPRCKITYDDLYYDKTGLTGVVTPKIIEWAIYPEFFLRLTNVKLHLRRLSDMTEEEMNECGNMVYDFSDDPELNKWRWQDFEIGLAPEQFHWLLKKRFDLFGLIDDNLAIETKTT